MGGLAVRVEFKCFVSALFSMVSVSFLIRNGAETIENGAETIENSAETIENDMDLFGLEQVSGKMLYSVKPAGKNMDGTTSMKI